MCVHLLMRGSPVPALPKMLRGINYLVEKIFRHVIVLFP